MFQTLKLSKFILFAIFYFLLIEEVKADSVKLVFFKENKPERIFLFPSRVSLLSLPCLITKALVGSPNDIKAEVDKLNFKDVHILLKKWGSKPSNLILKCKSKVFLFNLIPSKNTHFDYIKVLAHISSTPFKVKSALPNSPSLSNGGLRKKDFTIKKILDSSLENKK